MHERPEPAFDASRQLRVKNLAEIVRRAFGEFLKFPAFIVAAFLMLAAATTALDHADGAWLDQTRNFLRSQFFRDPGATSDLLATIAGSVITVTSITFSLLLLAVQQAASALTHQVYDQFLRRRINQVYFGFFVGIAVFALIILATVDQPYNPVLGAALALLLTIVALILLILLLYTTINQMRPVVVIQTIHDHILVARENQLVWIAKTRPTRRGTRGQATTVRAPTQGYVARLEVEAIIEAAGAGSAPPEVELLVSTGSYVAFHDPMAEVRATSPEAGEAVARVVQAAIHIEQQRDLDTDPAYGIEQLATIGWTSVSTAKSNPAPGLLVLHSLRDVLARWSLDGEIATDIGDAQSPIVYRDDVVQHLMDAFESFAVVASESMQSQTTAELMRTLALMLDRVPDTLRPRLEGVVLLSLSALGDHVLTSELDAALSGLVRALEAAGSRESAERVRAARDSLAASVGILGSRATRARGRPRS